MQRVLLTGANRGIGLALARELLADPEVRLFASCRRPEAADALNALAAQHGDRVTVLPLDINDPDSINAAVAAVAAAVDGLDLLINNAGIHPHDGARTFGQLDADVVTHVLRVNAVGPLLLTQAAADLLARGRSARVVNVSSQMGALSWSQSGGSYAYRASKAALNMFTVALAGDLRGRGVIVVTVHPGWVQTDMGGAGASLTPQESARGIARLAADLTPAHTGRFFRWDGSDHAW